jgi:hypothetical protein
MITFIKDQFSRGVLMRFTTSISSLLLATGIIFNCAANAANTDVVATVGKNNITLEDFNKRYDEVKDKTLNPPSRELFLEDLVRYEVGVQEAEKRKIADDPLVAERLRQETYKGLIEKDLGQKIEGIKITDAELKKYYDKNPEIRSSHILIEVKPGAVAKDRAAAKKRAEEIYSEVKKSKRPFEELVTLYTDDSITKPNGGDIGYQSRLTIVPDYYNALFNAKVGSIIGPVETKFGYHIIKVTDRHSYDKADKRQVRAAVFDEQRKEIFDAYFKNLKSKYSIKENKSLLK